MTYRLLAWLTISLWLGFPQNLLHAEIGLNQFFLPQRQDIPLSPRTHAGRKNLRYEYDLHPSNVFRHLEVVITQEKRFKLKHHLKLFQDDMVFGDDL